MAENKRIVWAFVACAAATACGGGGVSTGTVEEFCSDWHRAEQVLSGLRVGDADSMRRIRDSYAEVVFPESILGDANDALDAFDGMVNRLEDTPMDEMTPKEQERLILDHRPGLEASERVIDFADDNC